MASGTGEFIAIVVVTAVLLAVLIFLCFRCWRGVNQWAQENGTGKREALSNRLRNSFRSSFRKVGNFHQNITGSRHRMRQYDRNHDRATVISESSSCSSPQYINAAFFNNHNNDVKKGSIEQLNRLEHTQPSRPELTLPNGHAQLGQVSNGIRLSIQDLNANIAIDGHEPSRFAKSANISELYSPKSHVYPVIHGSTTHISNNVISNNSSNSHRGYVDRPDPLGRSASINGTLEISRCLPSVKQSRMIDARSAVDLTTLQDSNQSFNNRSINSSSSHNSQYKISPYQKYYNERYGLPPGTVTDFSDGMLPGVYAPSAQQRQYDSDNSVNQFGCFTPPKQHSTPDLVAKFNNCANQQLTRTPKHSSTLDLTCSTGSRNLTAYDSRYPSIHHSFSCKPSPERIPGQISTWELLSRPGSAFHPTVSGSNKHLNLQTDISDQHYKATSPKHARSHNRRSPRKSLPSSGNVSSSTQETDSGYNERYVGSVGSHSIAKMRRAQSQEQLTSVISNTMHAPRQSRLRSRNHVHKQRPKTLSPKRRPVTHNGYAYPHARRALPMTDPNSYHHDYYNILYKDTPPSSVTHQKRTENMFRPIQNGNIEEQLNRGKPAPDTRSDSDEDCDDKPPLPPRRYLDFSSSETLDNDYQNNRQQLNSSRQDCSDRFCDNDAHVDNSSYHYNAKHSKNRLEIANLSLHSTVNSIQSTNNTLQSTNNSLQSTNSLQRTQSAATSRSNHTHVSNSNNSTMSTIGDCYTPNNQNNALQRASYPIPQYVNHYTGSNYANCNQQEDNMNYGTGYCNPVSESFI